MTAPQQPVARLSERVTKLERQRVTYREATVLAVDTLNSTFDAEVAGAGRLDGIPTPPQFMPAVGDVVQLQLSGATPIYQPQRIGEGTIGTTELAGYVTENITIAMDTATGKNKAWFSPNAPTVEVGSAAGDPWFKRDNVTRVITGTWEWDGDSWEPATYGDEVLSSLTVGKLVGGTGTFDLIVGGRIATADTGERTELNPLGLQGFDDAGNLTYHLGGGTNLLKGELRTGDPGERYVQIGASGNVGAIEFHTAPGVVSMVRSVTSNTGSEALQMTVPVSGAHAGWNAVQVQAGEELFLNSKQVTVKIGGATTGADRAFTIQSVDAKANPNTGMHRVFVATPAAVEASYAATTGSFAVTSRTSGDVFNPRLSVDDTSATWWTPGSQQRLSVLTAASAFSSPVLSLVNGNNVGGRIKMFYNPADLPLRFEFLNANETAFERLKAAGYDVPSDISTKRDIRDFSDSLSKLRTVRPKKYKRRLPADESGAAAVDESDYLGLIAQEVPVEMQAPGGSLGLGVDLYAVVSMTVGAVGELADQLDSLKKGIKL